MSARSSSPTRKHSAHFAGLATGHQHSPLAIILNHVDAYVFMKDADGRYIYANSKVCEVMQYPLEEILGHTDAELLSAEAAADIMAFDQQALASPFPLRREESIFHPDGTMRIFQTEKVPVRQPDGTAVLIGFATEITHRKAAEANLRASKSELQHTLANLPFPVALIETDVPGQWTDLSARCLFFNRCWLETLGYQTSEAPTVEELKHRLYPDADYRREVMTQRTAAAQHAAANGGIAPSFEVRITAKDGTVHHMLSGTSVVGRRMIVALQDITELRQREEALRLSEERHRFLAENARDTVWTMEPDGTISYVSPSIEVVRGFTPEEAMAQTLDQIHPPESLARATAWWEQLNTDLVAGRTPENFRDELAYYRKDGSIFWTEVMAYPLLHPDGSLAQVIGVTRDMAERKQAELELQRSERKFRTLFEAGRNALLLMDNDGRFIDANPAAWRIFRCPTREELAGMLWTEWSAAHQPDGTPSATAARDHLQRASLGEDVTFEWMHRRRNDGIEFPCEVMLNRIEVDGQAVLLASIEDLTEKKKAAAELSRSEEHYRLLSDSIYDTVLRVDNDSVVTWISPSLKRSLGYDPEEWIGRRSTDFLVPEDAPRVLANIERALSNGEAVIARYSVFDKSGRLHTAETYATPYLDAHGNHDGVLVSFHLIDAQVAAEQELERRARTDELTNLLNRREAFDRIRDLTSANSRTGEKTAVLFCDLDKFKQVNDTHGHQAGDEVLGVVAARLRTGLRHADDVAARVGGDELMIVLHGVHDKADALAVAEKLRSAVAEPIVTRAGSLQITISIGVTLARPDEASEELIARADTAMYQAKQTGRNQVVPID
jgi:diguanylate cyclase (GGDEF)-like protein/PAS domain S-box-containing protein